ncbi:MAG TPA: hypothetical protein VEB64_01210 [Azospirillaceae bacterium]|nr:hypothetical protein [Azospirillaceae bacterium]
MPVLSRGWLSGPALVVLVCVISLVGMAALLGFVAWRDRVHTVEHAETLTLNVAEILGAHATRLFESADYILRQAVRFAGPPSAPIPSGHDDWRALKTLLDAPPYMPAIWLGDAQGRAVLTTRQFPAPPLDASGRPFFHDLRDGRAALSMMRLEASRFSGESLIILSRPLPSESPRWR